MSDTPWRNEKGSMMEEDQGDLLTCPVDLILQCAERVVEKGEFGEGPLNQLWTFLTSEVSR